MNPTKTAEQLRLMRTRAVLCYNAGPAGPVYSIHATAPGLGVLSGSADLIEAQAAQIEELREEVKRARENEQAALDRAARARLDFQREFHGQLQEAIAAEREACAHIVECKALCRAEAAAKIRGRSAT